ncbi:MAG: nitrate reductase subunit alpha NarG, partial [Rhodospirillales bacterium]|nr:nitrate reductase subunit alpha NarG [Rhodospirillales bacterium]
LFLANYGIDRGLGGANVAASFDEDVPYTPAWQERITGVSRDKVVAVAREFAENAAKTNGRSMIIVGAALNHWYHMDMIYRGIINLLVMCGCVGQSGGGWSHYVGQEKLRPQSGWLPLAFALDWGRPPRQMNATSFWYAHTDQWRYEQLGVEEILSPLADKGAWPGLLIDYNVKAERMGWLPSAPQLGRNPLELTREAGAARVDPKEYAVRGLDRGTLRMASEDPDNPANFPRNLFVWRSNLLGSSGKGHEYFLKHLLGAQNAVMSAETTRRPTEVVWRDEAPQGKLDLLVTIDFRMSTTCMYSDIVLPTATWYEKDDLNTSDMHPFIHPLTKAVDPAWESRSDWEIFKGIARKFSEIVPGHLGVEKDLVLVPLQHDSPAELGQATGVQDWKKGECAPVPGKTMPGLAVVERDYPNLYKRFTALGPLMDSLGNSGKGMSWKTGEEIELLKALNGVVEEEGPTKGLPKIETEIEAAEVILTLAPETNGHVAVKAWKALSKATGREHAHLALPREDDKIRFRDVAAQPRKIISSPIWSGLESEKVSYTAGYTNVHELIPWRTLSGRQQLFQDHPWMTAFGEQLCVYKPPIDTRTVEPVWGRSPNGNAELVLNFITPHQKWGIHSTYSDNLLMLTLNRGGPVAWIAEPDAKKAGIADNDWIELYNANGAITCRAVVSQRVPSGMCLMYHAQEKIVNVPGSEVTKQRGGIHNSVTRIVTKPTHMIGGYAQQSYGFNYYGTVGSNRDEFVIVRKMDKVDWLEGPATDALPAAAE